MRYLPIFLISFLTLNSCLPSFNKSRLDFSLPTPKVDRVEPRKPSTDPVPQRTFDEIMQAECVSCHKVTLNDPVKLDRWMSAESPEASRIFREVESGDMPQYSMPLPTADLEVIRARVSDYQVKEKILIPKCLQCHSGTLNDAERFSRWVVPGKPEESRLYLSVKSGRMPKGGAPLTEFELKVLENYILNLR